MAPDPGRRQQTLQRILLAAIQRIQAGDLGAAQAILSSEHGLALASPVGRNILGDVYLKQGRPADALAEFDRAISAVPHYPEAHCNRAVALQELRRLPEALAAADAALRGRPDLWIAHFNRGNILEALGRTDEAIAAYDRVLTGQPDFAEALVNRGMALLHKDEKIKARNDFGRALELRPDYAEALVGLTRVHLDLHEFDSAESTIAAVLRTAPDNPAAKLIRCSIDQAIGRHRRAVDGLDDILARDPGNLAAHRLRGEALASLGRHAEAADALERAEELGASGYHFQIALANALTDSGRYGKARNAFGRAIALDRDNPTGHYLLGLLDLRLGDFAHGWEGHEWRLKRSGFGAPDPALASPWRGERLHAGNRILLYGEQGIGDTIQFVRFVPELLETGASVTLLVQESLRNLVGSTFPNAEVIHALGMRSSFDFQASLMSLPHILQARNEARIPRQVPYVSIDADRVDKWRDRLGPKGFRIGIAWQGNPRYPNDHNRSIPLSHFAPLAAIPGVRLISLQAQHGLDQLDTLNDRFVIETLGEELTRNPDGFREMAAIMQSLDLIVTSDSAPAHLAGALGLPTWIALATVPDWRWMHQRSNSPWYPTMRLFRQTSPSDWNGLFAEIARAVADLAARRPVDQSLHVHHHHIVR